MILIVCLDDNNGMMFNHRRQSQDRILRERMLRDAGGRKLWMNAYSAKQFAKEQLLNPNIVVDEGFLQKAETGDFCFAEDETANSAAASAEEIIVYRWNRRYPADQYFKADLRAFRLADTEDFAGSSHEKITKETYVRR